MLIKKLSSGVYKIQPFKRFFMCRFLTCVATAIILVSPCLTFAETAAMPPPSPPASAAPAAAAEKLPAPATAESRFRVGYVDIMKVAAESDAGKIAKAHFEGKADRHKAQIDTKQKLLEKQKATLEAKLPTYTPEQRTAKIKEYEKKVDELKKMLQKADSEMRPMQEELIKEVYGKIAAAARTYGAANGFSVILEKRELLYLGKGIDAEDVTEILIKELNKK
jgi:outer membrane protein